MDWFGAMTDAPSIEEKNRTAGSVLGPQGRRNYIQGLPKHTHQDTEFSVLVQAKGEDVKSLS